MNASLKFAFILSLFLLFYSQFSAASYHFNFSSAHQLPHLLSEWGSWFYTELGGCKWFGTC